MTSSDLPTPTLHPGVTVQNSLKALFLHGAEFVFCNDPAGDLFCHKDVLISLLERGKGDIELAHLVEELQDHTKRTVLLFDENEFLSKLVLCFGPDGERACTLLDFRQTFEELRAPILPAWWDAPIPLLNYNQKRVTLNSAAKSIISIDSDVLFQRARRAIDTGELLLEIQHNEGNGVFAMSALDSENYFLEDISGDAEVAEQLLWWASIGKALVARMEENGLLIGHHKTGEIPPAHAVETLSCQWEENPLGYISISPPSNERIINKESEINRETSSIS